MPKDIKNIFHPQKNIPDKSNHLFRQQKIHFKNQIFKHHLYGQIRDSFRKI